MTNSLTPSLRELKFLYRLEQQRNKQRGVNDIYIGDDPVTFLESEMYITDTGAPMVLHPEQTAVLREMFRRDEHGFVYNLMLYSSIKKSAKTTIAAGILLWQAFRVAHGEIYIIGNDLRQADSRMAQAVRECIQLNPRMKGIKLPTSTYRIVLPNGTRIETIPVDPSGESGMNPSGIFITEAWGAKTRAHELLWTEARLSPTRQGESFKFVESYAGHSGQSLILERLYESVVKQGTPLADVAPELYASGNMVGYWNTRRYLPWQTPEYYAAEEKDMLPGEFRRVHCNEWAVSEQAVFGDFKSNLYTPDETEAVPNHIYVCGIDWGQANDYTAITIADATDYREVHIERWRRLPMDAILDNIVTLVRKWNIRLLMPEKNSFGHTLERLNTLLHESGIVWGSDERGTLMPVVDPFHTSTISKHQVVVQFQVALREGYQLVNDHAAAAELSAFQVGQTAQNQYTYGAPAGGHDDLVISRLLAHRACYRFKGL